MKIDWQRNWYFISQILSILGFVFFGILVFQLGGLALGRLFFNISLEQGIQIISDPGTDIMHANFLRLFHAFSNMGIFAVPVFIYTWAYKYPPISTLNLDTPVSFLQLLLVVIFAMAVLVGVGFISEINHMIPAPENIAERVKKTEELQRNTQELMLFMPNVKHLLFTLFAMCVVPAVSEELMFRGILQPLFKNWTKSVHQGILISAGLFSMVHYDYHDFISRFAIAIGFGYLYHWSGSLWITIIAHFLNNAIEVMVHYLKDTYSWCNYLVNVEFLPLYIELSGVVVVLAVLWLFKRDADKRSAKHAADQLRS